MKSSPLERTQLIEKARTYFMTSIALKEQFLSGNQIDILVAMADKVSEALGKGGKLMLCGNGGSAADAQHLATELLVRLRSQLNRNPIPALSLVLDPSSLTACANDYGFGSIFERMVQALGKSEDVLLGITTSGRSANVIRALKAARKQGIITLGFLGGTGGDALPECDLALVIPSHDPNRIQEVHITLGHILMDLIEGLMLERKYIERVQLLQPEIV